MVYRGGTIINIAGLTPVDDPEYRYKMPAVFGKVIFTFLDSNRDWMQRLLPRISQIFFFF